MTWQNWGRTESASPSEVLTPTSADQIAAAVSRARQSGTTLKAAGAGHSFSGIAVPGDALLDMSGMRGLVKVDGDRATFKAGTHLHEIPGYLANHGLAMANLGDIDRQTLAGATSTGTHGTGVNFGGISTQIVSVELVTGTGEICTITDPVDLQAAALGLGALGILTEITLRCVPAFSIHAVEKPANVDAVRSQLYADILSNDHFEFYWFPHTDAALTKRNRRLEELVDPSGPSKFRRYLDDELLSNKLFGALCRVCAKAPRLVPRVSKITGSALSERTVVDTSASVFTSSRKVRFREMEYAVPLDRLGEAFDGVRKLIADKKYRISFPIEVRAAAGDDLMLSTASERMTGYVAVHRYFKDRADGFFDDVEEVMTTLVGRPHWGKMHTRDADYMRSVYPRFDEFLAVRDRFDPDRVFRNPYLERVLGS